MDLLGKIIWRLLQSLFWISCLALIAIIWVIVTPDVEELGKGYIYDAGRKDILGKVDIPPSVVDFYYDKRFIVAIQKWDGTPVNGLYDLGADHKDVHRKFKQGQDSTFFWIIDKKNDTIFGPDSRDVFIKLCSENKVAEELTSKIIYSYNEMTGSKKCNQ